MEFFIRQNATDPALKLKLIHDGRTDKTGINDLLETAKISFEMFNVDDEIYQILNGTCFVTKTINRVSDLSHDYAILYRFTEEGTSMKGRFEGKVTIQFRDGNMNDTYKLIVPIQEKLYINVI